MKISKNVCGRLPLFGFTLLAVSAWAQPGIPFQGSFTIGAEALPNTTGESFCGGAKTDQVVIEGHGSGFSTLGAFTFTLNKTLNLTNGTYKGCLVLTAANGDTLKANYSLAQVPGTGDFSGGTGTITFTGGTGRFKTASGSAKLTAQFLNIYPSSSFLGGGTGPAQVLASYVVDGSVSFLGVF